MPIYEYKCLDCGEHLEKMRKVSDETLKVCEKCGGKLEKQWSRSGFQFKGEGWYVTDYAGKKSDGAAEKTSAEKSSGEKETAKTETASKEKSDNSVKETSAKKE